MVWLFFGLFRPMSYCCVCSPGLPAFCPHSWLSVLAVPFLFFVVPVFCVSFSVFLVFFCPVCLLFSICLCCPVFPSIFQVALFFLSFLFFWLLCSDCLFVFCLPFLCVFFACPFVFFLGFSSVSSVCFFLSCCSGCCFYLWLVSLLCLLCSFCFSGHSALPVCLYCLRSWFPVCPCLSLSLSFGSLLSCPPSLPVVLPTRGVPTRSCYLLVLSACSPLTVCLLLGNCLVKSIAYLLGLLAMIKCSICSYQCDN